MIMQELKVPPFGGRVTDIDSENFFCKVITAKEGLFQGMTTIVVDQNNEPCAKLHYTERLSKSYRQRLHTTISQIIDTSGDDGMSLGCAIEKAIRVLKKKDFLELDVNLLGCLR